MKYIISKSSREIFPYSGPTCDRAGVPHGKIYESKEDVEIDAAKLTEANPIGFLVYEWDIDRRRAK